MTSVMTTPIRWVVLGFLGLVSALVAASWSGWLWLTWIGLAWLALAGWVVARRFD